MSKTDGYNHNSAGYLLVGVPIVFEAQTIAWRPTRGSCTPTWRPRRTRDHGTDHPHCMVNADRAQTSPTSTAARRRGAKHIFTDTANAPARAAYLSHGVHRRTHLTHKIRLLRPESKFARPPHSQSTSAFSCFLSLRSHAAHMPSSSSSSPSSWPSSSPSSSSSSSPPPRAKISRCTTRSGRVRGGCSSSASWRAAAAAAGPAGAAAVAVGGEERRAGAGSSNWVRWARG
jgi:hypothetical protein